jgi:predicted TPR repeat methyltransferase
MNTDDRILRNPSVALAPVEDGYLAYDTESSRLHRLNPTAALIVELSDGRRTAAQLSSDLAPLVADGGMDGCARWMQAAAADGLLKIVTSGSPAPGGPSPEEFASLAASLRSDGHVLAAFVCQHYATLQMPEDADQWAALGELAHIVGRRDDARDAYERYLALSPGDAEVELLLTSLRDEPPPPRAPDRCVRELYARFAEYYEDNMCGDLEYRGPEHLAEALDAELGDAHDLEVVDLGCGTGLAGPCLRRRAGRLVGVDLSPEMIEKARVTGLYDALDVAEITEWLAREQPAGFELVAACDTLIYFGDLRQVFVPAAARMRHGGTFAFTVERADGDACRLTDSGRYVHSEAHIRAAAADAGMTVARITDVVIRYEYGEPVGGLLAVLRKS